MQLILESNFFQMHVTYSSRDFHEQQVPKESTSTLQILSVCPRGIIQTYHKIDCMIDCCLAQVSRMDDGLCIVVVGGVNFTFESFPNQ